VIGIDLVEVNPVLDTYNRTANIGTDLLLSAMGKQIL
jgi:arginase